MFARIGRGGLIAVLFLVAACGTAAPSARTVAVHSSGRTVTLRVGDRLVVTLGSTYWHPAAAQPSGVLNLVNTRTAGVPLSSHTCVVGQGCGTVTVVYQAVRAGHVVVKATRTVCGEAMLCVGTAAKLFTVTVDVS